ncbi:hypothetical protein [Pseudogemmobacter sonorensis]|uniref:hypothetical protein n=1 Tax=Pseudogemmobacter sonorensis TaxID=2989681 RepID=UPI003688C99A
MAAIYLLTKLKNEQTPEQRKTLKENLEQIYPGQWFDLGRDCYLVATTRPTVTRDLAIELGVRDGSLGNYLVTKVEQHAGYASSTVWEWFGNMRDLE